MKQGVFNLLLVGLYLFMGKTDRNPQCRCDPKKFLENEDCPIHLKAKTPLGFDGNPCAKCGGDRNIHPAIGLCSKCL